MIQLATQLVSAQIAAHSHHETAMNLFHEFRQLALDVADLLRPRTVIKTITEPEFVPAFNPAPDDPVDTSETPSATEENVDSSEQNFESDAISRCMDKLMTGQRLSQLRSRKPRALQPMSHPDLDRLFQSAMRRSFVMLNAPFDPERVVFAEQIFSPSELLAEGAIRRRFIDFRWPNIKSGTSVTRLMNDVNRWFSKHLQDLQAARQSVDGKTSISATDPDIPIATRIEAEAARLSWLLKQTAGSTSHAPDTLSSYQALESALSEFTNNRNGSDIGGVFRSLDATNRNNLIFVMFGGNGPRDVDASSADNGGNGVSEEADIDDSQSRNRYRPWAIFRYLRRHGRDAEDELGRDLYNRLRARRCDLAADRVPDIPGIEPAEFEFGPLHQEAEDLLDELEAEGGSSDCATNSDELELHGFDPQDIASAASEFDTNELQPDDGISKF